MASNPNPQGRNARKGKPIVAPKGGREGTTKRRRTTMDSGMEAGGGTRRQAMMRGTSGRMERDR
jgi:hypothetical protein